LLLSFTVQSLRCLRLDVRATVARTPGAKVIAHTYLAAARQAALRSSAPTREPFAPANTLVRARARPAQESSPFGATAMTVLAARRIIARSADVRVGAHHTCIGGMSADEAE